MRTFFWLLVAPFVGAALVTAALGRPLSNAHACSCDGDSFWVVEDVTVEGATADWPTEGHLYPDSLHLWAEGFQIDLRYGP